MKASIIIRTLNEQKWLGAVLKSLSEQNEKDFEVVVVDSGSHDKTLDLVSEWRGKLNLRLIQIKPADFTYPRSCNIGAEKASGEYLVYLSGHSVPIGDDWLANGLNDFSDRVAGVYGNVYPLPDASIWEKFFYGFGVLKGKQVISKARIGVLGNTNAIIRKDLWQAHQFDERLVDGGEDTAWARFYLDRGYLIIRDPKFSVMHSHGLGLVEFVKQFRRWKKISK